MSTTYQLTRLSRPYRAFARHYLEMLLAMVAGMMILYPLWLLASGGQPDGAWMHRADVEALLMATTMVVPMALWMRFRRHAVAPVVEMSLAMYAGFVVLFPFLWMGALDAMGVTVLGHVLMLVFMLGAMLARRHEYTHVR